MSSVVAVVSTGIANTASVASALRRCGCDVDVTDAPARIAEAAFVVLPGVGSFGAGMASLRSAGLERVLAERVVSLRPTLAICLGLQLLCEGSEETPGVSGLGVIPGVVRRFGAGVRVPQFGWNRVEAPGAALLDAGWAYYANSYRLVNAPEGWTAAVSDHGGQFVAALERGPVLACQFHPELSGAWGGALLRRWLATERVVDAC